jgi:hypothetical protein
VRFGFSVKSVAAFLAACRSGRPPCRKVRAEGVRLLAEMNQRIAEMSAARDEMQSTLEQWDHRLGGDGRSEARAAARDHSATHDVVVFERAARTQVIGALAGSIATRTNKATRSSFPTGVVAL